MEDKEPSLAGDNSKSLLDRLHAAALRVISGNGVNAVGRDGRTRFGLEDVVAHGRLASILREIHGDIPQHNKSCAARTRLAAECNCPVRAIIEEIGGPLPPRIGMDVDAAAGDLL